MKKSRHPDNEIIRQLGGPTEVSRLLGMDADKWAVQRVQNWTHRGIPAAVRLAHLDIFGPAPDKSEAA